MIELFSAGITSIDIIVVYSLLQVKEGKLALALWTSLLNMLFPFLGFITGEFSMYFFTSWSSLLSGILLALIGIHMLLQDNETVSESKQLPPFVIALAVCLDTFSVSVSFGMLQMDKFIFILASGIFAFTLAYLSLTLKGILGFKTGHRLRRFAGLVLLIMGVLSCIR
ncbi:manganese efflux pump [Sporosarcina sp. HYO08]|uniref:manganese efflux pump n=1 Tax=Sporosarcina sp. HYO08 TaxID=1759557 RepID=UPI00155E77F9|nr:manganese efflux pump [Sporosarcina sp. HYO08]